MLAEIKADGYLHITSETPTEAFALKYLMTVPNFGVSTTQGWPIVINCSMGEENETN